MKTNNFKFKTKDDYINSLLKLAEDFKQYYTEDKSRIFLGESSAIYDDSTIGIEGFARVLWGLVPLWASGDSDFLSKEVLTGIRNGVDPSNPAYWGKLNDYHQAFVEMTPMALGILIAPDKMWNPLTAEEKNNFNNWLLQLNDHDTPHNNWLFFRVLMNLAMKRVGAEYSAESIERDLNEIETFYLGDGWYSDGLTPQKDYYISFAIHFYSLIYAKLAKDEDPERSEKMIRRAKKFAQEFIYWFSEDGSSLAFGRSLTYRFAQCSFWTALAFADVEAMPWGVIKGIVNRHFEDWFSKPILNEKGILTVGYAYANLNMAEGYNSPSSPYWAFKSLLMLALPKEHPFWQAEEEPLPKLDAIKVMKHPRMIVTRPQENNVIALTSGQYADFEPVHCAEKYCKFAYSSKYAFHVARSYFRLEQAAPDNMLSFIKDEMIFVRRRVIDSEIREDRITSTWSPMEGITVQTVLIPHENGHIREHTVKTDFDIEAVECGFGIPVDNYRNMDRPVSDNSAELNTNEDFSKIELLEGKGQPDTFLAEPNTNLIHPRTAIPCIKLNFKTGITKIRIFVAVGTKE